MRSHAKRIVVRAFWLTTLLFGVVLFFGSFSPVSADTIGSAGELRRVHLSPGLGAVLTSFPQALIPHQRMELSSKATRY